ncbi:maleylpyruvate isomerase family mycothiol-dependent enzyme [Glycomyces xiaoerkulensis]|uniref:maleylpyruvate isomerase family mycothiol-dependent enzyme n=1 Tax=Glycomyces xiaoerkulensis TaxID=2038139 RepID=UPI000C26842D|nr:maleylpyruvate isomerase family mycothiol-dependent enzyme [Glycomyces xiaoerkulensis]
MAASVPLLALRAESARLAAILRGLTDRQWTAPTRCTPWDAAALVAHITMTLERLGPMLDADPPARAEVDAAGYYRPDHRYAPETNAIRIDAAAERAAAGPAALTAAFDRTRSQVAGRCAREPAGRTVTTRHGDPMTLADFLTTRVVEVAVHGIDLADAVGLPRWTTAPAAGVVADLLLGDGDRLDRLGWNPVGFIAKATGREAMTDAERAEAERLGLTPLTLG